MSFRKHMARKAHELRITGWVRNLADGSVQGCFEGDDSAVEALLLWSAIGPERARVDALSQTSLSYTGEFLEFSVLVEEEKAA